MSKEEFIKNLSKKQNSETSIIETETVPEMVKFSRNNKLKNPYFGKLKKNARYLCRTTYDYSDEVNKQRIIEGKNPDFVAQPSTRGIKINDTPIILEHNGKLYTQVIIIKELSHEYTYMGEVIGDDLVKPYLNLESQNKSQGLDNPVIVKRFELSNIVSVM